MQQKPQSVSLATPRRAIPATPPALPSPRSRLARLAARMPEPSPAQRMGAGATAAVRPVAARTVGAYVPRLTRPAFEKFGFSAATLITDWSTIVGADIARYTVPERLKWPRRPEPASDEPAEGGKGRSGATLILGVAAGRALDIQYRTRQLVERINAYFGYAAVADLRIVQLPALSVAGSRPAAGAAAAAAAAASSGAGAGGKASPPPAPVVELSGIADQGLRAALERMAAGLVSRKCRGIASP